MSSGYLEGQILIAMPTMADPRFARTLIYMCAHNADGAMGLVINKPLESLTFDELLEQLEVEPNGAHTDVQIHFGGPVESGRGFVLHTADFMQEGTLVVDGDIALTATVDVLREMARGAGPRHSMLALGYAGWAAGQLESEIQENAWLHVPADPDLLFGVDLEDKWELALKKVGVADFNKLSGAAGHA